jgi:hypothetical protein
MEDWKNRPVDAAYLMDSGLLFEINRQILHMFGISFAVKKDDKNNLILVIKDNRNSPEEVIFSKEVYERGHRKLLRFMKQFGWSQMKRRSRLLGWTGQSWHVPENRRYKK